MTTDSSAATRLPTYGDMADAAHYRQMWLAASAAHRRMFAWFLFSCVQALVWMGVALWALT